MKSYKNATNNKFILHRVMNYVIKSPAGRVREITKIHLDINLLYHK